METILKCSACNQGLCIITEPRGLRKDGSPSTVNVPKLVCKNCGKRYETPAEVNKQQKHKQQ